MPWSTWPMMVITGGRVTRSSDLSSSALITSSTSASETRTTRWPNSSMISSAVSASMDWFWVTIRPLCISAFTTSATRSAIRFASSWTTIVSGSWTSRTTFSRLSWAPMERRRSRSCLRFIEASERCRPPSSLVNTLVRVSFPARRLSSLTLALTGRVSTSFSRLREFAPKRAASSPSPAGRGAAPSRAGAGSTAGATAAAGGAAFARSSAALRAASSAALTRRSSSSASALARMASSRSRSSRSLASISARRRSRSSARRFSSASRSRVSSTSRALAACSAFRRRSISASVIPAGRRDGSPGADVVLAAPPACLGTTTRLRLVSTTTFFVRPWLKLCFTCPDRGPPWTPRVFLPSLSFIWSSYPFRRGGPRRAARACP